MKITNILRCILFTGVLLVPATYGEQMLFPTDFGHVNVKNYGAKGDGTTDDTKAIQTALDSNNNDNIIYLPKGTYLVSNTIKWPKDQKRVILWGEDRYQTIIRLKDNCPTFSTFTLNSKGERVAPVPLIWTGTAPAQRFRNGLRNLTINTGRQNPAVSALQYNTSNQGSVLYVDIISGDGGGHAGLDISYTGEIGPGLIYDMKIVGFDIGVKSWVYNSMTLAKVVLENQKEVGIKHVGGVLTVWGLTSKNSVPAILSDAVLTLIDADLSGGSSQNDAVTIRNGSLYARNVTVSGYKSAIINPKGTGKGESGPTVKEFTSHAPKGVFEAKTASLNLPLPYPPKVPWENDMSKWANPMNYGAVGDGKADDTKAVQAAIDDNTKTTLYFPVGKLFKVSTIKMRGSINRFVTFGWNRIIKDGVIEIVDGSAPVVQIDNFNGLYHDITIKINTNRTALVTSCTHAHVVDVQGKGTVYLMDNAGNTDGFTMNLNSPNQMIYSIQHNPEGNGAKETHRNIINNGSNFVAVGFKTENWCTKIHTQNGGFTEVLGGWMMGNGNEVKTQPMFSVDNAQFSAVNILSYSSTNPPSPFLNWIKETRLSDTRVLKNGDVGGSTIILYTGYSKPFDRTVSTAAQMNISQNQQSNHSVSKNINGIKNRFATDASVSQLFMLNGRRILHDGTIKNNNATIGLQWVITLKSEHR